VNLLCHSRSETNKGALKDKVLPKHEIEPTTSGTRPRLLSIASPGHSVDSMEIKKLWPGTIVISTLIGLYSSPMNQDLIYQNMTHYSIRSTCRTFHSLVLFVIAHSIVVADSSQFSQLFSQLYSLASGCGSVYHSSHSQRYAQLGAFAF